MFITEMRLKPCLQFPPEAMQIDQVDPAIHVPETIGWAYYCIGGPFKNIAERNAHIGNAFEVLPPGVDHIGVYVPGGFCVRRQGGDRWQRRRCDPRYDRRFLCREESAGTGGSCEDTHTEGAGQLDRGRSDAAG